MLGFGSDTFRLCKRQQMSIRSGKPLHNVVLCESVEIDDVFPAGCRSKITAIQVGTYMPIERSISAQAKRCRGLLIDLKRRPNRLHTYRASRQI